MARVLKETSSGGPAGSNFPFEWGQGRDAAPIGAEMFEIVRRNHSRTGVYAARCISVLLDTSSRADTLAKVKNGFKFGRFDVFFHISNMSCIDKGSRGSREGSK